jgi:predicted nucleic acid-binding protein
MMLYLDTNILVYSLVNQDHGKMLASQALINQCIAHSSLLISPLTLQELAFTLAKLNLPQTMVSDSFEVFKAFAAFDIDLDLCDSGFQLALATNMLRNINDAIHARFAERHAARLVTYDAGFRKFAAYISIPIDILT